MSLIRRGANATETFCCFLFLAVPFRISRLSSRAREIYNPADPARSLVRKSGKDQSTDFARRTQIGYLAPVNGVLNVWIRTLGKSDDRAVTSDTKRGIRNFDWQYDNQHILYTQDVGGDENWRLYQTDIASKQTKDLTPWDKVRVDLVAYEWRQPDRC